MSTSRIFQLQPILDDQIHEGFGFPEGAPQIPDPLPRNRTGRDWKMLRLAPNWKAIEVIGRVRKFNDFPNLGTRPVFSTRAVNVLRDYLEANGELLPINSCLGTYFYFNVTTIADVLDCAHSDVVWAQKDVSAIRINRFEFLQNRIEGLTVFTIPQLPAALLVTDSFRSRALDHGLRGIDFRLLWPLPEGTSWRQMAAGDKARNLSVGLPPGQTIKGNSVIIRLHLMDRDSKGTDLERKAVNQLESELNSMFYDPESDAPSVGWLEGHDFGSPGECRLFLSCPDADELVSKLTPWLRSLRWSNGYEVYKRYGSMFDAEAKEVRVK